VSETEIELHEPPATVSDPVPKVTAVRVEVDYADGTTTTVELDGATRARLALEVEPVDFGSLQGVHFAGFRQTVALRFLDCEEWRARIPGVAAHVVEGVKRDG
jgi:hypothetical protein